MNAAFTTADEHGAGSITLHLDNADATCALAARLAPQLGTGDTLLLVGPIGAGKTHFARALISACLASAGAPPEDIPSPTYTLVQTYLAGALEIWHADLYRLTDAGEATELGLESAFVMALCLIEWPDRISGQLPDDALTLRFNFVPGSDTARALELVPSGPRSAALARAAAAESEQ